MSESRKKFGYMREEILFWFEHISRQKESVFTATQYCKKNKLDSNKFVNMRYKIFYTGGTKPDEHDIMIEVTHDYFNSPLNIDDFALQNSIDKKRLAVYSIHVRYMDILEEEFGPDWNKAGWKFPFKEKTYITSDKISPEPSFFIAKPMIPTKVDPMPGFKEAIVPLIPEITPTPDIPKIPEVIEAKNDIEIIISAGVKVVLYPNVSSEKLVKIITLLREL